MNNLEKYFPEVILDGYNALDFSTLFNAAKEFLDNNPKCTVKFNFNGILITVNENTEKDAWNYYWIKSTTKI